MEARSTQASPGAFEEGKYRTRLGLFQMHSCVCWCSPPCLEAGLHANKCELMKERSPLVFAPDFQQDLLSLAAKVDPVERSMAVNSPSRCFLKPLCYSGWSIIVIVPHQLPPPHHQYRCRYPHQRPTLQLRLRFRSSKSGESGPSRRHHFLHLHLHLRHGYSLNLGDCAALRLQARCSTTARQLPHSQRLRYHRRALTCIANKYEAQQQNCAAAVQGKKVSVYI